MIKLLSSLAILALLLTHAEANCDKIKRSTTVLKEFKATHPCPLTGRVEKSCKGYIIDHIYPLCAGGTDTLDNLTWQELQQSKYKDRLEKELCRLKPRSCEHQDD